MKSALWNQTKPGRRTKLAIAPMLIALATSLSLPADAQQVGNQGYKTFPIRNGASVNIYIPPQLADPVRAPLVVLLHPSGGHGLGVLSLSKLKATADKHGFLIAMPDGGIKLPNGFGWNVPGVPTTAGAVPNSADRDDVAYLNAVMDALIASRFADPGRIYVTGMSGGGRMASWLGCVASPRIAAIAPVVGLRAGNPLRSDPTRPDPDTCKPSAAMPVLAFAGDADAINPIAGGGSPYWQYPMAAAVSRWATLNGCNPTSTATPVSARIAEERYVGCHNDAEVVSRITKGGQHRWLADNEVMWAFFAAHNRGKAK